jgi:hypothetical protein
MKKLIFVLCLGVMSMISCADMFVECPNQLYCNDVDVCCPVGYSYACGGLCYTNPVDAYNDCGKLGYYVDHCYAE